MRVFRMSVVVAAALVLAVGSPTGAAADGPADVSGGVSHEDESQDFEANPDCGGAVAVTETQQGTERVRIVEHGDSFHFMAGESVWTTTTSQDPSFEPVPDRKITDAVVFHDIQGGRVVVFHESFQDRDTFWGDIQVRETYVEVGGEIKVERFTGKNLPPDGC